MTVASTPSSSSLQHTGNWRDLYPRSLPRSLPSYTSSPSARAREDSSGADSNSDVGRRGAQTMEGVNADICRTTKTFLYLSIFLVATVYSLDSLMRWSTFLPTATSFFREHSSTALITTLEGVVGAVVQPTGAKLADVVGRLEMIGVSLAFYVLGIVVQTIARDTARYCLGAILYTVGYIGMVLVLEVIIADTTTVRARVFFSYVPIIPFLFNSWISGNVAKVTLNQLGWRWASGLWAPIYAVCTIPLILTLYIEEARARRRANVTDTRTIFQKMGVRRAAHALFWYLDVIGMIILVAALGLTLTPLSYIHGDTRNWKDYKILVPLSIGVFSIPCFVVWEYVAPYPLIPYKLLKDRGVWGALGIALTFNAAYHVQWPFLTTVLRGSYHQSLPAASRIANMYSFASAVTGPFVGLLIYKVRYTKPFIILGTVIYFAAFGMMVYFDGGTDERHRYGHTFAQVLLGVAGGMFPFPTLASIQAVTTQKDIAAVTGMFLAMYRLGSAIGSCIAGALWHNVLRHEIEKYTKHADPILLDIVFNQPIESLDSFAIHGTETRTIIDEAYRHAHRYIVVVGAALCLPLIGFAFALRNQKIGEPFKIAESPSESQGDSSKRATRYQIPNGTMISLPSIPKHEPRTPSCQPSATNHQTGTSDPNPDAITRISPFEGRYPNV